MNLKKLLSIILIGLLLLQASSAFAILPQNMGSKEPLTIDNKGIHITTDAPYKVEITDTTEKELVWNSSDPNVIKVDGDGNLTGIKPGVSVITVKTKDGRHTDSMRVNVYISDESLGFHKTAIDDLVAGEKEMLRAVSAAGFSSTNTFKWVNKNPDIVDIFDVNNTNRTIRALRPGVATITLSVSDFPDNIASCKITVLPYAEPVTTKNVFSVSGKTHKIPDDQFGVHYSATMENGADMNAQSIERVVVKAGEVAAQAVKDIGFQHIRSYWSWWNWKTGTRFVSEGGPGPNTTSLNQLYDISESAGVAQILNLSTISTVDEMVEEFIEAKKLTSHPMYIEFGNEVYAMGHEMKYTPSIEAYIERLKELSTRLREIDPTVKIGVPWISCNLERAIFNDPNNFPREKSDWEYTQGIRALTWNVALSENAEYFDAIIPHLYAGAGMINSRQTTALKQGAGVFAFSLNGTERQLAQVPGKEAWFTEYGEFPHALYSGGSKVQSSKSLDAALNASMMVMQSLDNPNFTKTSFHYLIDPQGFGVFQLDSENNPTFLPQYYMFSEIGKLLGENDYYYGVNLENGVAEWRDTGTSLNQELQHYVLQNVHAWGLGDENGIKKIAFLNLVPNPSEISISNMLMKPEWHYHSDDPYPDFIWSESGAYTNPPKILPLPEQITGKGFSETITIQPYSFTVVEVTGDSASRMSSSAKEKLQSGAIMRLGDSTAYDGIGRVKIDLFDNKVVPIQDGDDIYVPLRSLSDIFRNYLKDIPADDSLSVEIIEYRDMRTDREQDDIDVSKVTSVETGLALIDSFFYNTEFKVNNGDPPVQIDALIRDTAKTLTGADVPRIINGQMYVSAKLAGEIFDRNVTFYKDGLITFTKGSAEFTENEIESILNEYKR